MASQLADPPINMHFHHVFVAAALALVITSGQAQSASPRGCFEAGANAYLKDGANAAIAAWLKGSALEGNTQANSNANMLRQIEDFYGKPDNFTVVGEFPVSERVTMVLGIIHYQKGPLFSRFQVYKAAAGWISTEFKFNTDAYQIFPERAMYAR